jgi:adenylate kinase family enzyme
MKWSCQTDNPRRESATYSFSRSFATRAGVPSGAIAYTRKHRPFAAMARSLNGQRLSSSRGRPARTPPLRRPTIGGVQRVAVVGPAGAGKSVIARTISHRTGLPVVHLDLLFWRSGWTPAPKDEALRDLAAAVEGERWILDGNFLGEVDDERFARADTVIFLDFSRTRCTWRVLARIVRDRGRARPDLPERCFESLDLPLLRWIWSYPKRDRPRVLRTLARLERQGVGVHRLRSPGDVRRFLATLAQRAEAQDARRFRAPSSS